MRVPAPIFSILIPLWTFSLQILLFHLACFTLRVPFDQMTVPCSGLGDGGRAEARSIQFIRRPAEA